MPLCIRNLAGVFTGEGFAQKQGRHPEAADCGFLKGPVDIVCDSNGRVASIRRISPRKAPPDRGLDGTGLFATAGFVDSHTHTLFAGSRAPEFFQRWAGRSYVEISRSDGGIRSTIRETNLATDRCLAGGLRKNLSEMLRCGCTTVEVKSGYADSAKGELRLLRIINGVKRTAACPRVSPTFLGLHVVPAGRNARDHCSEMIRALPEIAARRMADHVDSFPERSFFTLAESLRFSEAAAAHGLALKAHADELSPLGSSEAFIRRGARSIDHLQHISSRAVALLAKSPTVATLLPCTSFFLGVDYAGARRLLKAGARVALGSDYNPGTAPVPGLQLTMLTAANSLMMTAAEVLCACTYNGAAALGGDEELGALLPGRCADLLLWEATRTPPGTHGLALLEKVIVQCLRPTAVFVGGKLAFGPVPNQA